MGLPYWQILLDCLGTPVDHPDHRFNLLNCVEPQSLKARWTCRMAKRDVRDIFCHNISYFQNCCSTTTAKSEVDILNLCTLWDVSFFRGEPSRSMHWACVRGIWYADEWLCWMIVGKRRVLVFFWCAKPVNCGVFCQVITSASSFLHGGSQRRAWRLCAVPRPHGRSSVPTGRLRTTRTGGLDERKGCSRWELCHELQWSQWYTWYI